MMPSCKGPAKTRARTQPNSPPNSPPNIIPPQPRRTRTEDAVGGGNPSRTASLGVSFSGSGPGGPDGGWPSRIASSSGDGIVYLLPSQQIRNDSNPKDRETRKIQRHRRES